MFQPVRDSFLLLSSRQKFIFSVLIGVRVVVHLLDVVGLAAVGLLGAMLAGGLSNKKEVSFLGFTVPLDSTSVFLWVVISSASFFIVKSVLSTVLLRLTTVFLARVETKTAHELSTYLFSGTLSRIKQFSRGELEWAVNQSSHTAFLLLLYSASALVTESALFLAVLVVFIAVDPLAALLISTYFVVLISVYHFGINGRLKTLGERLATSNIGVTNSIMDLINAFREATVLEKRPYFLEQLRHHRELHAREQALERYLFGLPRFFVEAALMVGILGLVLWQYSQDSLSNSLVTIGVFLTGGLRMMAALLPLQTSLATIRTIGPRAQLAHDILRAARSEQALLPSIPAEGAVAPKAKKAQPGFRVDVDNVAFRFEDADSTVISDVSLAIASGSFVALVGPSGAGKTTLADLILGIYAPDSGSIRVDGLPPEEQRRRQPGSISYVPQRPGMVSGTIAQNVAIGISPEEIDRTRVKKSLVRAHLWDFVKGLPGGIDAEIGKQSDALSGGQIQRLGLARALFPEPKLLILDEATSALDAETEASIAQTIEQLGQETTVIVIAHRLSTIQRADRVYVLDSGKIVAEGTFPEVRKAVPLIEQYVQYLTIRDETEV